MSIFGFIKKLWPPCSCSTRFPSPQSSYPMNAEKFPSVVSRQGSAATQSTALDASRHGPISFRCSPTPWGCIQERHHTSSCLPETRCCVCFTPGWTTACSPEPSGGWAPWRISPGPTQAKSVSCKVPAGADGDVCLTKMKYQYPSSHSMKEPFWIIYCMSYFRFSFQYIVRCTINYL